MSVNVCAAARTLCLAGAILWLTGFVAPLAAQGQNERPFALPEQPEEVQP